MIDRGADRQQERIRIETHPQHQDDERREHRLLARAKVDDVAQILAGDRAEDHPAIEVEHVHRAEEQRGRGEEAFQCADPEGAEQDQELADKAAGAGQPDRSQHEAHEDKRVFRHAIDQPAISVDIAGVQPVVDYPDD